MFIKSISGSQHHDHGCSLSQSQQNSYTPHRFRHVHSEECPATHFSASHGKATHIKRKLMNQNTPRPREKISLTCCFLAQGTKPTFKLQQAGIKSKGRPRAGRAPRRHDRQEHLYHLQMSETPSLSSCTNLLPSSILFPNPTLQESTGPLQQVIALSGRAICSNQLLLKSQEAHGRGG